MNIFEIAHEIDRRLSKHFTLVISADGPLWDEMLKMAATQNFKLNLDAMNEQLQKKGILNLEDWRDTWAIALSIINDMEPEPVLGSREAVEAFLKR